jgi:acyl-coenzyme A thioesterase 9
MQPVLLQQMAARTGSGLRWVRGATGARAGSVRHSSELAGSTKSPVTEHLWRMRREAAQTQGRDHEDLPSPEHLVEKTPIDSSVAVTYPFTSDHALKSKYANSWGYIRMGVLLEDLDALAGTVAFNHCDDNNPDTRPLLIVTACVDQISILRPLRMNHDIELSGQVSWVGRSSMEIRMEVASLTDQNTVLEAFFTFVARDKNTGKGAKINTLLPQTEQEHAWFSAAEKRAATKKAARQVSSADAAEIAAKRQAEVAAIMAASRPFVSMPALAPPDTVTIADTRLSNTLITQPQHQNTAGRVFGGFLMRRAFEIAFSCCYVFAGSRPHFLAVDDVTFKRPVEIGTMLQCDKPARHQPRASKLLCFQR